MAEESTRRLLKNFGIAVTELEESAQALTSSLAAAKDTAAITQPIEAYLKAQGELLRQWAEVGRLLAETQERANGQILSAVARLKG
jgi:hypothetical protein